MYESWSNRNAKKFVIHDGPPYANGDIHLGHAVNKILKDTINRFKALQGYNVLYMLAWDCHGLPIETKVEAEFKSIGIKRDQILKEELINSCKKFAQHYIDRQLESFIRLGVISYLDKDGSPEYYTLMDHENEIIIVEFIHQLIRKEIILRKLRPVFWSCEEKTALADAEIEYFDKKSKSVDLLLEISSNTYIAIWTTTPWTLPSNRAIAYNPNLTYSMIEFNNKKILILDKLIDSFIGRCKIHDVKILRQLNNSDLEKIRYKHPLDPSLTSQPLLPSDHVSDDQGTGFVHLAPDHGLEDFYICQKHNISCCNYLNDSGHFHNLPQSMQFIDGKFYVEAISSIMESLAHLILNVSETIHSYPHSWRSGKPVIFRATNQWFIDIDSKMSNNLSPKEAVLKEANNVSWYPEYGKNRFISTVSSRESWCISRQRLWGVPLCFFHNDGAIKTDLLDKCLNYVRKHGIYSWHEKYLDLGTDVSSYEKVDDICDVWIESGLLHRFLKRKMEEINKTNALPQGKDVEELIIEGTDQHRAWFQCSFYTAILTTGRVQTKMVVTHGFVVDEQGKKMSKSKSNSLSPDEILNTFGLDCLRLWVLTKDFTQDLKISNSQFIVLQKIERKIQITLKFLINNAKEHKNMTYNDYSALDKWVLHHIAEIQQNMSDYTKTITSFSILFRDIHNFCEHVLSKIYFDAIKDSLYFDSHGSKKKSAIENILFKVLNCLLHWIAPFMPVLAEESWQIFSGNNWTGKSIHSNLFPKVQKEWENFKIWGEIEELLKFRLVVNQAIEKIRSVSDTIKNSNDCKLVVLGNQKLVEHQQIFKEICGLSDLVVEASENLEIKSIEYIPLEKCNKCKKRIAKNVNDICKRCEMSF